MMASEIAQTVTDLRATGLIFGLCVDGHLLVRTASGRALSAGVQAFLVEHVEEIKAVLHAEASAAVIDPGGVGDHDFVYTTIGPVCRDEEWLARGIRPTRLRQRRAWLRWQRGNTDLRNRDEAPESDSWRGVREKAR